MFAQLKPVAYNNIEPVPIPFNELLQLAQMRRQDQQYTEQRIDAVNQFIAQQQSFGLGNAHVKDRVDRMSRLIEETNLEDASSRAALRRGVLTFTADPFWAKNRANFQRYTQALATRNALAARGELDRVEDARFRAMVGGDRAALKALMNLDQANQSGDNEQYYDWPWDGISDFDFQFSVFNPDYYKATAESAAKNIVQAKRATTKNIDGINVQVEDTGYYEKDINDAVNSYVDQISKLPESKRALDAYLADSKNTTVIDPKTGKPRQATPEELAQIKHDFFASQIRSALPTVSYGADGFGTVSSEVNAEQLKIALQRQNQQFMQDQQERANEFTLGLEALRSSRDLEKLQRQLDHQEKMQREQFAHQRYLKNQEVLFKERLLMEKAAAGQRTPTGDAASGYSTTSGHSSYPTNYGSGTEAINKATEYYSNARKSLTKGISAAKIPADIIKASAIRAAQNPTEWVITPAGGGPGKLESAPTDKTSSEKLASEFIGGIRGLSVDEKFNLAKLYKNVLDNELNKVGGPEGFLKLDLAQRADILTKAWGQIDNPGSNFEMVRNYSVGGQQAWSNLLSSFNGNVVAAMNQAWASGKVLDSMTLEVLNGATIFQGSGKALEGMQASAKQMLNANPLVTHIIVGDKASVQQSGAGRALREVLKNELKGNFSEEVYNAIIENAKWTGVVTGGKLEYRVDWTKVSENQRPKNAPAMSFLVRPRDEFGDSFALYDEIENMYRKAAGRLYTEQQSPDWREIASGNMPAVTESFIADPINVTQMFDPEGNSGNQYAMALLPNPAAVDFVFKNHDPSKHLSEAKDYAKPVLGVMMKQKGSTGWVWLPQIMSIDDVLNTSTDNFMKKLYMLSKSK